MLEEIINQFDEKVKEMKRNFIIDYANFFINLLFRAKVIKSEEQNTTKYIVLTNLSRY